MIDLKCTSCGHWLINRWCPFGKSIAGECDASPHELAESQDANRYRWILVNWRPFEVNLERWGLGLFIQRNRVEREIELSLGPFHISAYWERCWVRSNAMADRSSNEGARPGHRHRTGATENEIYYS